MIVVAGATGFMGGAIARHLLAEGHTIRVLGRSAAKARQVVQGWPQGPQALADNHVEFAEADVTNPTGLREALTGADTIIYAAQFPGAPVEDPKRGFTYMNVDRGGVINVLGAVAAARANGTGAATHTAGPRFMYLSGIGVTGNERFTWARAKLEAEAAIQASGLDWTIVRSSWAYGPGDRALNRLLHYTDRLPFLPTFGPGTEKVTPVFVEDVGRLFARAVAEPAATSRQILPLGGPQVLTMNDVLAAGLSVLGRRRLILHMPLPLGRAMGAVAQYLPGRPLTPGAVDFVAHGGAASLAELQGLLPGFEPSLLLPALRSYLPAAFARAEHRLSGQSPS